MVWSSLRHGSAELHVVSHSLSAPTTTCQLTIQRRQTKLRKKTTYLLQRRASGQHCRSCSAAFPRERVYKEEKFKDTKSWAKKWHEKSAEAKKQEFERQLIQATASTRATRRQIMKASASKKRGLIPDLDIALNSHWTKAITTILQWSLQQQIIPRQSGLFVLGTEV